MKKILRIVGSIIITMIAAIYLFIIVASLFEGEPISFDPESLGIVFLSILTIISAVMVWVKVDVGVWMVLAAGVLFSIFALITAGRNHWMAVMAAGGPLIIGGALVLLGTKMRGK